MRETKGTMRGALMIQGTCSGAGKSLLTAALCRILSDMGVNVAPYKSQNMALNSFITAEGAEIGRAQALQAEAARLAPHADMNPVLLKATADAACQVIVDGRVRANMSAREYYDYRDEAWAAARGAYDRLASRHDVIVIEGAGSPAEINLREEEIVNMRVARYAGAPVLLVGDIDRGGVFASFAGTVQILGPEEASLIQGYIINKFRGDLGILRPGLGQIRDLTGIPVMGVLPYVRSLGLDEEDGLASMRFAPRGGGRALRVVAVMLRYISNFTDLSPLMFEPDVELVFSTSPTEIMNADLLIIPGSKNTANDLNALREMGLDRAIIEAAGRGVPTVGLCGGYQMLGQRILDPLGVEGPEPEVRGLGLLEIETVMDAVKVTSQSAGRVTGGFGAYTGRVEGYEIHMGRSTGETGLFELERRATGERVPDGSRKGSVWGTYLHGVFDLDAFRASVLDPIRAAKGLPVPDAPLQYQAMREEHMNRWAATVREHLDMDAVLGLIGGNK
jgi:adenosylcobyric acid synthase